MQRSHFAKEGCTYIYICISGLDNFIRDTFHVPTARGHWARRREGLRSVRVPQAQEATYSR